MKITIDAEPKEIAALIRGVQERHSKSGSTIDITVNDEQSETELIKNIKDSVFQVIHDAAEKIPSPSRAVNPGA